MVNEKESRKGIVEAISKPIQLAALVVLVVEGLLAYLLSKADMKDISLYVGLMVGILVLTIVAVFFIHFHEIRLRYTTSIPATGVVESARKSSRWDVFLAAPMAALNNQDFKIFNAKILEIKRLLEVECGFKNVFYAGENMKSQDDFETADISIETDIDAIKDSKYFVLIYPEKIVSSVLLEAGVALALGKPSFYFGNRDDFPFLMREANNKFHYVKIHNVKTLDEIIKCVEKNKHRLFDEK